VLLDDLGLEAALRHVAENHCQRTGQDVQVAYRLAAQDLRGQSRFAPSGLAHEQEVVCFRIVQEALANVARHAQARKVTIELNKDETGVRLVIRDDGVGFDVAKAEQSAPQKKTFGLLGMKERSNLLGGRIDIESAPGLGTVLRVHLPPLPPSRARDSQKE
jgi:two-component system sensor histidine kinase UhpB